MTFKDLVNEGIVEWVDAEEEEDLYIAPKPFVLPAVIPKGKHAGRPITNESVEWTNLGEPGATTAKLKAKIRMPNNDWEVASISVPLEYTTEHTHCEIDPQLVLGVCASLIPYPEHNSTPRVTGGTAMVKQSLGLPSSNYRLRPDTRAHILHYPQRSITRTRAMETTNFDERPGGQNFIVAIMSLHGYNMQDAVIMNRGSIDLGLGRSTFMRTYNAERRRFPGGQVEEIEKPGSSLQEVKGLKPDESYLHLEADGLPLPEKYLEGGDVLVGKTSPPRFLEESSGGAFLMAQERRESSMLVRHGEKGWVDNVYVTESLDSGRMVRVMVRSHKVPEVGDKFASRHGQKGVIGRLVDPEDMPFTAEGVVPDLIINPHAIPSRMTVAHVLEMIGGKVGSLEGRRYRQSFFLLVNQLYHQSFPKREQLSFVME